MLVIVPFGLYLTLQILAAKKLRSLPRALALLPVLPMIWILIVTVQAFRAESNMWPILLILGSIFAVPYIGFVWLADIATRGQVP